MLKPLNRYSGVLALLFAATTLSMSASTARVDFLPEMAYGVLIIAALAALLLPLTFEVIQWLELRYAPGTAGSNQRKIVSSLKFAVLSLSAWVCIAGEQLVTEFSTTPTIAPVAMVRVNCSVSNLRKITISSYKASARSGDWCFHLTGKSVPASGILHSFKLAPDLFNPAPPVGGRVDAWMVSYDSSLFGPSAYVKIVGKIG